MFLPGQIKRNRFIVLKDGRKMFVDDVDFKGNNNPFGHFAIHVVPERGSTEGEWVTGEQVVRVVSDPIQRPDVVDMGPLAYNRPTKQKTMNEKKRLSAWETENLIKKLVKLNEDTQVANTILQQMGGAGKLRMMLGVKQFTAYPNGVGFAWPNPRRAQSGNYCKIMLTPSDTYRVEFLNVSRGGVKPIKSYDNVYFDQLIEIFEKQTGWYLKLREAISPEERSGYVAFAKGLKQKLQTAWGLQLSVKVIPSLKPNPFIAVYAKGQVIPNPIRAKVVKALGITNILNWDDIRYGNIQPYSIDLYYSEWKKLMDNGLLEAALDPQARSTKPVRMVTCKLCQGTGSLQNGKKCDHCNGKGTHAELRKDVDEKFEPSKARGRWMPTKVTKPPKKGKGAPYNRQQFKKGDH